LVATGIRVVSPYSCATTHTTDIFLIGERV
jgi:hypothetical protein